MVPAGLEESAAVMIAFQNEYLKGRLALPGAYPAVNAAKHLLAMARRARRPVLHIAHRGHAGGCFDPDGECGQFVEGLVPGADEPVIETAFPGVLPPGALRGWLGGTGARSLILAGFMTDVCVSATARAARRLRYRVTVVASACATRGLPGVLGGVDASDLQAAALAELAAEDVMIAGDQPFPLHAFSLPLDGGRPARG